MAGRMRWGMLLPVAVLLFAVAGCGAAPDGSSTTFAPTMGTPAPLPPHNVTVPAPDGKGPVAAIVWGTEGQFDTAPLMAVDRSGRTLAYGVWSGGIRDVSVCPGSERIVALGWRYAEPGKFVSVWDLARLEVEDVWPVDDRASSVRCIADEGAAVVFLHPTGMDPSPPTSAGPTTTIPQPVGGPAVGSNTWSIIEVVHGEPSTVFDAGEYGTLLAFTARWVVASHNTTLWIVDLDERPPQVTTFETTFPATAAIDPTGSFVVVAGQYPRSSDPVELSLFRLGLEPSLVAEATVGGVDTSAWAWPFVWLDSDRFLRGSVVYDRDLRQVDTWPASLRKLAVGREAAFGIRQVVRKMRDWKDALLLVDVDTGATTQAQTLEGSTQGIVVVDDGPLVAADAYQRVPEPTIPPPRAVTDETALERFTSLPRLGSVDASDLQEFRDLVAGSDAAGVAADMAKLAGGLTVSVPMGEIDACSGVGFAAGARSSQALGKGEFAGRTVIVYAFRTDDDVTVAAVDPASCEILGVAGTLLTPGPGVNITTTVTAP